MSGGAARPGPSAAGVGLWLVGGTAVVSGISTFVNGYAVAGTSSDAFVTVRNVLVAALLVPLVLLTARRALAPTRRVEWAQLALVGLIGGAVPFLLFFKGLQLAAAGGGSTTASFVYRTLFLWAIVLGVVALGERFRLRIAAAAALLLGGSYLMLAIRSPVLTDGSAYVAAATLLWAVEYTLSKRLLRRLAPGTVALGRMGFGGAFLTAFLAATGGLGALGGFGPAEWGWVAISALLLTAFVALWYPGLARVDLGVAASVLVLGYPVTFALATLVQGTRVTAELGAGALLVVAGVLLAAGPALLRAAGTVVRPARASGPPADG